MTTQQMDSTTQDTIRRIITSCVYGDLATIGADGKSPRVRPVCAFLQEDFTILIPSHTKTRKIEELRKNPRAEICFVDSEHWQVRAAGEIEVVDDTEIKKNLIETTLSPKLWRGFFSDGENDEKFVLYRLKPESFEWMREWQLDYKRVDLDV